MPYFRPPMEGLRDILNLLGTGQMADSAEASTINMARLARSNFCSSANIVAQAIVHASRANP